MILTLLLILLATSVVLTTALTLATSWWMSRRRAAPETKGAGAAPFLSILKPLSGLDDELEENLASFAALEGLAYEVVLSVEDPADPAVAVVERVRARFPQAPFVLVTGGRPRAGVTNPKVERLIAAYPLAKGDVILISDSNVRAQAEAIQETLVTLADRSVGCVSSLFVGAGPSTFGAWIESLHLLTFVVPGNVLAAASGVPCVVGKSMALTREVLEKIGGFEAFRGRLAEDQAIGLAVCDAGHRVVLGREVVRNIVVKRRLAQAWERQVRWNKIRWAFGKATYFGELLLNPFGLALAVLGASLFGEAHVGRLLAVTLAVGLVRVLQALVLSRAAGLPLSKGLLLMPVKDAVQFAAQVMPLLSRHVTWHGHRARLGPGTVLLPAEV